MSKRSFHAPNWTPAPTADTTALPANGYMALKGGSATAMMQIIEVEETGLAGASNPLIMQLARCSGAETTPTALAAPNSDGFLNPAASALTTANVAFVVAGTNPQRSAVVTDTKLELGLNAFGGIVRWQAAPGEEWWIVGNSTTLSGGLSCLSNFTGGSSGVNINAHIVYEVL